MTRFSRSPGLHMVSITKNGRDIAMLLVACVLGIVTAFSAWAGLCLAVLSAYCLLVYLYPIYGICFTIFLAPIRSMNLIYDNLTRKPHELYPLGAVIFLISWMVMVLRRCVLRDSGRDVFPVEQWLLFLILFFFSVSFFWTLDAAHGINMMTMLILGLMIMQIIQNGVIKRETLEIIFIVVAVSGFIWASIMIFSFYWYGTLYETRLWDRFLVKIAIYTENRRIGGFSPPQSASNTLAMVVFFLMARWTDAGWKMKCFLGITGYLCIMAILIAASKGAVGALFLGLLATIWIEPKLRAKWVPAVGLVISSFVGVYVMNMVVLNQQRLTASTKVAAASWTARLGYWETGFHSLLEDNWWGSGTGGYASIIDPVPGAHSFYFDVLFDGGIIGVLLFTLYLGIRLIHDGRIIPWKTDMYFSRRWACLIGALIMFFIHSLVELNYTFHHLWVMVGVMGAMASVASHEKASKGQSRG